MSAKARILLVDDQPSNLNTLSHALINQYELSVATSGTDALTLAEQDAPDLILLDVMMPDMDGLETLRRLRHSHWGRDIPVILVTADDRTETQVLALDQGADDFIAKPVVVPVVQARVRNMLERRRLLDQVRKREEQFRRLSEDAPLCISTFLPDGTLTYVNRALAELANLPADALLGRRFFDWLFPEEQERIRQQLATLTPQQPLGSHEQIYIAQDSQQRILQWMTRAFFDTSDAVISYQAVGIDITERKRAEERLRLIASVFEHANEGITITGADANIIDVNAAFTRITGYRREEVIGKNPRILNSGRQNQAFYKQMWQTLHTKGNWVGEVWNRRKNGEVYAELLTISTVYDAQGRVQYYIALFSDISTQKEHQRQLEQISHYDALTGLPNRVMLADRLRQAMAQTARRGEQIAVACLDLDSFKTVNDTYGHEAGDRLLVAVAERMRRVLREGDTLARLGGDEFVVVLNDLPSVGACLPLLKRLLNAAAEPHDNDGRCLQVSASLGASVYPQADPVDADQLLRQADQAMYQAKLAGKNHYHLFDAVHDRKQRDHHEERERIRQALAHQEFVLYYQPKVDMGHSTVIGAEALIRWQHPERGLLSPGAFLPLIDNHALMVDLGDWVIETALAQISAWRATGVVLPVSVNIDALQLAQTDFIAKLGAALARYPQVQPSDLELEVLETSTLQDIAQVSETLRAGQALGVSFALDDFGTGYSSLSYLKRLPVATIKIDQSFVRDMLDDPDDLAILEGIISLAGAFRRKVIAEGVETAAHSERLLQLGCQWGQGYAIARPMPAAQIPNWCAQMRGRVRRMIVPDSTEQ